MSAYIVDKEHILYLVQAVTESRIGHRSFSWWHNEEHHMLRPGDYERAADVANMLWLENVRSVSTRYPHESSATLPGTANTQFVIHPRDFNRVRWMEFKPAQILKACDCYAYQTCEHEEWKESEAFAFINSLRSAAWHSLPDYEACVWGAPESTERKVVKLSSLGRPAIGEGWGSL